jgi:DNA-binding XRE family transcriptional regulator
MRYNEIIKNLRTQSKITQRKMASQLGITETYLYMLETRRRLPGKKLSSKIAEMLNFNPQLMDILVVREKHRKLDLNYTEGNTLTKVVKVANYVNLPLGRENFY